MAGIFDINNNPLKVLKKYAIKEYGKERIKPDSYLHLQSSLINIFKKKGNHELKEAILESEYTIQYSEAHNFDIFMSLRIGVYAIIIAVLSLFISLSADEIKFLLGVLIIILVSYRWVSDKQKEVLLYQKFKLKCQLRAFNEKNNIKE